MVILLLICLLIGSVSGENVRVSIADHYLDYVAEVVDRTFIKEWGPTIVGKVIPGAEGTLYKLDGLQIKEMDLGHSDGSLHDGYMLLSLRNASAFITGHYEAYAFWTIEGDLLLNIAGDLTLNISVGANNSMNMTSCTANYTAVELDLQNSAVNWLSPVLKPTIKTQVSSVLCDLIDEYFINVTNEVIASIPEQLKGAGGHVSLAIEKIGLSNTSAEMILQIGDKGHVQMYPIENMSQDMCLQIREEVLTSLGQVFLSAGTVTTTLDLINLLYGEGEKQNHDDVQLYLNNTGKIRVGFAAQKSFLAQVGLDTDILVKPRSTFTRLTAESLNIGSLAMSGTIEAKMTRPGQQHIIEYALNNLFSGQKYVKISKLSYDTAGRQLLICSALRLKEEFIDNIIAGLLGTV